MEPELFCLPLSQSSKAGSELGEIFSLGLGDSPTQQEVELKEESLCPLWLHLVNQPNQKVHAEARVILQKPRGSWLHRASLPAQAYPPACRRRHHAAKGPTSVYLPSGTARHRR